MIIIETSIPDINVDEVDLHKLELMDRLISFIYPFFDEAFKKRGQERDNLQKELKAKVENIKEEKNNLLNISSDITRCKKVKLLLQRVNKVISMGFINNQAFRREIIDLLNQLDKLPNEKLDYNSVQLTKIINKRLSS